MLWLSSGLYRFTLWACKSSPTPTCALPHGPRSLQLCAAHELPLTTDDEALFGPKTRDVLDRMCKGLAAVCAVYRKRGAWVVTYGWEYPLYIAIV
jgi:hypothetical protein